MLQSFYLTFVTVAALIAGDDWDYPDVRRAVTEISASTGRSICVEGGKCWTFAPLSPSQLEAGRALHFAPSASRTSASRNFNNVIQPAFPRGFLIAVWDLCGVARY